MTLSGSYPGSAFEGTRAGAEPAVHSAAAVSWLVALAIPNRWRFAWVTITATGAAARPISLRRCRTIPLVELRTLQKGVR